MPFLEHTDSSAPSADPCSEKGFDVLFRACRAGPQLRTGGHPGEQKPSWRGLGAGEGETLPTAVLWLAIPGTPRLSKWATNASAAQAKGPRHTDHTAHGGSWGQGGTSGQGCTWNVGRDQKSTVEPNSYQQTPLGSLKSLLSH